MAARQEQMQVVERRLRGVYDALDLGNSKRALTEADKILKKHPNTTCAKVLRALALIRLERVSEACAVLDEEDKEGVAMDENTLQAFTHCYKEIGQPERIVRLYARACEQRPTENLLSHLFMSYVRTRNHKEQQQVALKLYRLTQNGPYYLWAIMSIIMQAIENPEMGAKMFLPLAEKMLKKLHADNGGQWKNAPEVELMCLLLEKQSRYAEAADLIEGKEVSSLLSTSPSLLRIRVLGYRVKAGQFRRVVDTIEKMFRDSPSTVEQWTLWIMLYDSTEELIKEAEEEAEKKRLIARLWEMVDMASARNPEERSTQLAKMELWLRLDKYPFANSREAALECVSSYALLFHPRPSCFLDISKFLPIVADKSDELDKRLADIAHDNCNGIDQDKLAAIWAAVLRARVANFFASESTGDGRDRRRAAQCISLALRSLTFPQAAAALVQIAANSMWSEFMASGNACLIYELLIILEQFVHEYVPEEASLRLFLIHLYARLGCHSRALHVSHRLEIKMVMRDTLGHLFFHIPEQSARFRTAIIRYTDLSAMYDQAEREINECCVSGYKNGSFSQLEGVIGLGAKMRLSSQSIACDVSNRYLSSLFALEEMRDTLGTLRGDHETIPWSSLSDNRDVSVVPTPNPRQAALLAQATERSHHEFLALTKTRHLLCRVLAEVGMGSPESFAVALEALEAHINDQRNTAQEEEMVTPLAAAPPVYVDEWIIGPCLDPIVFLLSALSPFIEKSIEEKATVEQITNALPSTKHIKPLVDAVVLPLSPPSSVNFLSFPTGIRCLSRAIQSLATLSLLVRIIEYRVKEAKKLPEKKEVGGRVSELRLVLQDGYDTLTNAVLSWKERLPARAEGTEEQDEIKRKKLFPVIPSFVDPIYDDLMYTGKAMVEYQLADSFRCSCEEILSTIVQIKK